MSSDRGEGSARERYTLLASERASFLERAYKCSEISIPSVLPRSRNENDLAIPYQSLAAQGVNNLAAKLMMSLLPPNAPFFKLAVDRSGFTEEEKNDATLNDTLEKGLAAIERSVMRELAGKNDRVTLFEGLKHLLITGNVLFDCSEHDNMVCYHLDSYVVDRDDAGKAVEILIKASLREDELTDDMRGLVTLGEENMTDVASPEKPEYDIYTWIWLEDNQWRVRQEIEDTEIPDTAGTYPLNACPWIPARMIAVSGENYGRSYIEEYYGDIASLDGLTQAILEGTAEGVRILHIITPNATLRVDDVRKAANGAFVVGNPQDMTLYQPNKAADLRVAFETASVLERRLQYAFLLNSAIQRNAERVTAEEIRRMTQDLDTSLGGVYSRLTQEFQVPYITVRLLQMKKDKKIPNYPEKAVNPIVITGVEALGRGNDQTKLVQFFSQVNQLIPQAIGLLNMETVLTRLATASGVDTTNLIRTKEELQAETEQARQMEMVNKLGPTALKAGADMLRDNPEMTARLASQLSQQSAQ